MALNDLLVYVDQTDHACWARTWSSPALPSSAVMGENARRRHRRSDGAHEPADFHVALMHGFVPANRSGEASTLPILMSLKTTAIWLRILSYVSFFPIEPLSGCERRQHSSRLSG